MWDAGAVVYWFRLTRTANWRMANLHKQGDKPKEQPKAEWTIAGAITALSGERVAVSAEGRSLSCFIPEDWREKLAGLVVGARVKLYCRGVDERSAAVAGLVRL